MSRPLKYTDSTIVQKSFRVDKSLLEDFEFKFGDVFQVLFTNTLKKCLKNDEIMMFLMFDEPDDFISHRSIINNSRNFEKIKEFIKEY